MKLFDAAGASPEAQHKLEELCVGVFAEVRSSFLLAVYLHRGALASVSKWTRVLSQRKVFCCRRVELLYIRGVISQLSSLLERI